jgi:FKBP-type peptidyl-prolyl cis-trans isomerase FkpA
MKLSSHTLRPFVSALALSLLAAPFGSVEAQTAPLKAAEANGGIIPLPLEPIVPAAQRTCDARTPSGLGYTVLRPAEGPKPTADDTVLINYIGYLAADGQVFDQNMHAPLPIAQVIAGFAEGLQLTGRTGVVRLCIPAAMGYGAEASGPIPANSDLVFQVELIDFKTAAELEEMRKAQAADAASLQQQEQ